MLGLDIAYLYTSINVSLAVSEIWLVTTKI